MPIWTDHIRRRLRDLQLSPTREREIVDELAQHLQDRYEELRARGASDESAQAEALSELDAPLDTLVASPSNHPAHPESFDSSLILSLSKDERVAQDVPVEGERASHGGKDELADRLRGTEHAVDPEPVVAGATAATVASAIWRDLRYAVRVLRKNPGFAAVAILTLALGIGATTAIFSVVNGVMLRPLPLANPDRLVRVFESDVQHGRPQFSASQPNFLDFRSRNHTFERLAATSGGTMLLTTPSGVESLNGRRVTADFLPAIGVTPAIGRNFTPEEDRPGSEARVAIVTHGFWQSRLGGDPNIERATLTINGAAYSVIGVLPASFGWPVPELDLVVPLAANPAQGRGDHQILVFGLLKPGVTLQQADGDLHAIAAQLSAEYPESNGGWSVLLQSFYDWLVPATTRQTLLVLLVAVVCVLLIAAGNVANLMLARAAGRQKEMSIRIALGAGRRRVLSQLLVESLVLALTGGALGWWIAVGATAVLKATALPFVPRLDEVTVDGRVLAFAAVLSIVVGVLFGLAPALRASRPDTNESLKDAGRAGSGGAGRQRLRDALIVAEVALSVALLAGAGLLVRSMWTLQRVNPGFDPANLLTMQVSLRAADNVRAAFFRDALEGIRALPGVTGAAASSAVPMGGGNTSIQIVVEGRPVDAKGVVPSADWRVISAGYFQTLGVSLRGRDFDERDADARVAIISEEMARRYWPGQDPIGRQFFWFSQNGPRLTVIGVAGDVRNLSLETEPAPVIYRPAAAIPIASMFLVVRSSTDAAAQTPAARGVIRRINPNVPITNVRTADEIVAASIGSRRFTLAVIQSFAAVALVLASIGLFGVMSYLVSQRTHDIGVRLALGAVPGDIFRLVVGRGMALAAGGAAVGVGGALALSRSLESMLFQVHPRDPLTFVAVVVVLLAVALVACAVPARRATRVDPIVALRYE